MLKNHIESAKIFRPLAIALIGCLICIISFQLPAQTMKEYIYLNGKVLAVETQASSASGCSYEIDPTSRSVEASSTLSEIIIDNGDAGSNAVGVWHTSGGTSYFGSVSQYSLEIGAYYSYETAASGYHEVYISWTQYSSRSTNVPVQIWDGGVLLDTVYVNQQVNGGKWNVLGSYAFSSTAKIVVLSESSSANTCADAVRLVKLDSGIQQIIIDNGDAGTSSIGNWNTSAGPYYYGSVSKYSLQVGANYSFEAAASGTHEVSLWWTQYSSRSTNVPVQIWDGGVLLDTVYVNQQVNGGKWNVLGTYSFSSTAKIVVLSESSSANTCADAVRLIMSNITGSVSVTPSNETCTWIASSNDSWITITDGNSGTGYGTVDYSVEPNPGPQRSGTATIAGETFTIYQTGD